MVAIVPPLSFFTIRLDHCGAHQRLRDTMADNNKGEDANDFAAINTPGGHTLSWSFPTF